MSKKTVEEMELGETRPLKALLTTKESEIMCTVCCEAVEGS